MEASFVLLAKLHLLLGLGLLPEIMQTVQAAEPQDEVLNNHHLFLEKRKSLIGNPAQENLLQVLKCSLLWCFYYLIYFIYNDYSGPIFVVDEQD